MPFATLVIAVAAAQAAPPAAAEPPKPMLICRANERETGSRIRRGRQCKTADQWAILDAARERRPADLRVTEGQATTPGAHQSPH